MDLIPEVFPKSKSKAGVLLVEQHPGCIEDVLLLHFRSTVTFSILPVNAKGN